jgi:glycosyltransferase involved in cell wall biosynthesis
VSVVLPAGEASPLLDGCLAALRLQEAPLDEIVVVDDTPGRELASLAGVRVVPSPGSGPYAARNAGWQATGSDVVLFLDVRSRPSPGWAGRLAEAFADQEVAVAGSDVRIRGGNSLGARAGERHQFFRLEKYVRGWYRPYFPTCNLAVRRDDLLAAGGFRETRSGADADLCWRILARPGRRLEALSEALMEWVPRDTLRGYLEQNYRYGKSNHGLRLAWAGEGAPPREPMAWPRLAVQVSRRAARLSWAGARRDREAIVEQMGDGARLAFELGYKAGARDERRGAESALGPVP